jgi:Na+/H+-translocating membrane pyrophosphatase
MDPLTIGVLSGSVIAGLGGAGIAGLKAWNGWLELKKMELAQTFGGDPALPPAGGRIEMADLKERVRKLEAIAAGIDI